MISFSGRESLKLIYKTDYGMPKGIQYWRSNVSHEMYTSWRGLLVLIEKHMAD